MRSSRAHTVATAAMAVALTLTSGCTRVADDESATLVGYDPVECTNKPWLSGRDVFFSYCHGDTTPAYVDTSTGDTVPQDIDEPDTIELSGTMLCSLFVDTTLDTAWGDTCFMRIAAIPKRPDTIAGTAYDTIWPLAFEAATTADFSEAERTVRYLEHRGDGVYQRAWGDAGSRRVPAEQLALPLNAQHQFSTDLEWACSPMMPAPGGLESTARIDTALLPGAGIIHFAGDTSLYGETYKLYDLVLLYAATGRTDDAEPVYERLRVVFHRALELNPANKRFAERVFALRQVHTVMQTRDDGTCVRRKQVIAVRKGR